MKHKYFVTYLWSHDPNSIAYGGVISLTVGTDQLLNTIENIQALIDSLKAEKGNPPILILLSVIKLKGGKSANN